MNDYVSMKRQAEKENRNLLVWVGEQSFDIEAVLPGYLHCHVFSFQGIVEPTVVISACEDGTLWRVVDVPEIPGPHEIVRRVEEWRLARVSLPMPDEG